VEINDGITDSLNWIKSREGEEGVFNVFIHFFFICQNDQGVEVLGYTAQKRMGIDTKYITVALGQSIEYLNICIVPHMPNIKQRMWQHVMI